jgi:hypothetical protein
LRHNARKLPPQGFEPAAREKKPAEAGSVAGAHTNSRLKAAFLILKQNTEISVTFCYICAGYGIVCISSNTCTLR